MAEARCLYKLLRAQPSQSLPMISALDSISLFLLLYGMANATERGQQQYIAHLVVCFRSTLDGRRFGKGPPTVLSSSEHGNTPTWQPAITNRIPGNKQRQISIVWRCVLAFPSSPSTHKHPFDLLPMDPRVYNQNYTTTGHASWEEIFQRFLFLVIILGLASSELQQGLSAEPLRCAKTASLTATR